jgi:hypothetical protein
LLRWALVLPHGPWLWILPSRIGGLRCSHTSHSSKPHSTSRVGSDAAACSMAPDPASLPKGALVLSRVHGSLWVVKIKKGIVVLGMQRGTRVTEASSHVTEVSTKCASRRRYHDLQDMRTCGYRTTLQCVAAWLTALRHGWQGP